MLGNAIDVPDDGSSNARLGFSDCIVAIDPGRSKCGVAVVRRNLESPFRSIVETCDISAEVARLMRVYAPRAIVVGNGTGSRAAQARLQNEIPQISIESVSESYSSEEARKRYVREVRPRGLERFLPASLRTPRKPYDDYVAVILGERYWKANTCTDNK